MRSFNKTTDKPGISNSAAAACIGKVQLESYERAAQVLKRQSHKAPSGRSAYHCAYCNAWHIGTDGGSAKRRAAQIKKDRKTHD